MWLIVGNKYTFELAQSFSKEYSGGEKSVLPQSHSHTYQWGLAIQLWQYVLCATGNAVSLSQQSLMMIRYKPPVDEALKYEGWRYVYRWSFPTTSLIVAD